MKKLIYSALISTLVISSIGYSSGLNVSAASSLNELSEINDKYSESFELNGVQYFYEDTNNYTLSITKAPNGEESIAYKDKLSSNDDEIYYQYTPGTTENKNSQATAKEISSLNATEERELNTIKEKVLNNEITLEKHSIKDFATVTHSNESKDASLLAADTSSVSKVNYSLSQVYGEQYVNKYLTSLTKDGYTGYLYQHMTFGATPKTSFAFDALAAIGIVATAVGTPISTLLGIAAWVSAVGGSYQLLKPTSFDTWTAKVYYQKEVKVGTIYPYRSFYDLTLQAVTGSQGYAALSEVKSTYKSSDYDNNTSILSTGIANYIKIK